MDHFNLCNIFKKVKHEDKYLKLKAHHPKQVLEVNPRLTAGPIKFTQESGPLNDELPYWHYILKF